MKKITVSGATGSVGSQALDIARAYKDEIQIVGLTAHSDVEGLAQAANEFRPKIIALTAENADVKRLESLLQYDAHLLTGSKALVQIVLESGCDMLVHAVMGIAGLPAFETCLQNGIAVGLSNKESLVCGGKVIRRMMDETGTLVLPVDSEHSAIFQCLGDRYDISGVAKIWITASGGPFLHASIGEIENAPVEQALKHPSWKMSSKITIDSATLANKGLEVIEAHYLYKVSADMIDVVVQPRSLIHSMVEFVDTSVMAQFAPVDMRLPLQKVMLHPKMCKFTVNKPLDFKKLGTIEFIEPDMERFPCLRLAYEAIENECTAVYSIADEVAVDHYLDGKINFGGIARMIESAMNRYAGEKVRSVAEIMELDGRIRRELG